MALLGPAAEPPHIVVGGGVYPTLDARMRERDPYDPQAVSASIDPEDGRVLDAAVAGRADVLVTWNFRDFASGADDVLVPGRVHLKRTAAHAFVLARPPETARWLRTGEPPPGADRRRIDPDQ
ncbi:PIN domain-containing protein [Salinarimonas chemoclinalis]|uniref:PIN domain-containing protein n=1 Tax=Salinarimonas chemoclinalis TaxID=3241599 RepID=UPI0035584262